MAIQAGVKIAVDQSTMQNAERQIIDFSKQMQNLLDNIKANIDVEASMKQLQELNNEIKVIKESLNNISSNSKPIIDTTQLQQQGDKAMQTIEQIKEQLSSMGEVQFKYTSFNEITGQFDKVIAKVKETDGVVKQFNAEMAGAIGNTPLYNLNQSSLTDSTQAVANRQAVQEQNQQIQESLSLLKQEYNLESDINSAKIKGNQETLQELQSQQQLVQSKLAESATGLSNDNRSQLIQQASQYQKELNLQISQQADKETQVNSKLEQQVAQFKTLAGIKIQNLESTSGDALKNSDIQSQINSLKQLKDTVNTTNFAERQTEWNNSLKQTQANVRDVNSNLKDQHSLLGNIGSDIGKFAEWTVAASALMTFVNGIKEAVTYVNQMDDATSDLSKVVDMSTGQLNDMKDAAVTMGKELGQSSLSIMQGFAETGRVLKDSTDIESFTKAATMASNVTDLSVQQASKAMTTTMISFHQNASQAMDDLNQWNEIQNNFRTSGEDLANGIAKVGSAAQQSNTSIQQLEGYITALVSSTGVSGEQAGTSIQAMISHLYKLGKDGADSAGKAEKALASVGIAARDSNNLFLPFPQLLDSIKDKWGNLTNTQKTYIAQSVGMTEHYSEFISLMDNYKVAQDATTAALNSNNSATKENEKYLASWSGKVGQLKATTEGFFSSLTNSNITKGFVSGLTEVMQSLTGIGNLLNSMTTSFKGAGVSVGILTAAFVALSVAMKTGAYSSFLSQLAEFKIALAADAIEMGTMTTVTGLLSMGLTGVATAAKGAMIALATNPLTWIAVAIGGIMALTNHLKEQKDEFQKLDNEVKQYKSDLAKNDSVALGQDEKNLQARQKALDDLKSKYNKDMQSNGTNTGNMGLAITNADKKNIDDYIASLRKVGLTVDTATGKIKDLKTVNNQLAADKTLQTAQRELQANTDALNSDTGKLISTYIQLSSQQDKGKLESQQQNDAVKRLAQIYPNLKIGVDSVGNSVIKNTDVLTNNTEALIKNQGAVNASKNQIKAFEQVESDLGDSVSKARTNISDINKVLDEHAKTNEWDYSTILQLTKAHPELISAMGSEKSLTEALTQAKKDEASTAEDGLNQQIAMLKSEVQQALQMYGLDISNFADAQSVKTALADAESKKRISILEKELQVQASASNAIAKDSNGKVTGRGGGTPYDSALQKLNQAKADLANDQSNVDEYFNLQKLKKNADNLLANVGNSNSDGKTTKTPANTEASKALTAQSRDVANQNRNIAIQSRNLDMQNQQITNQSNALDSQSRTLTNQSTALENQSKILDIQKQEQETAMENAQKSEQQHLDDIIKGYNNELDALKAKKDVQDETNQALDYQNKLIKDQQDLNNAQNQKVRVFMDGQWTYQSDTSKVSSARDTLSKDQEDYRRWQADQAEKKQEDSISAKIKSTQDQKDTSARNYNNQKDALDQSYQKQQNNIDMQKMNIQNQQTNISNEKANLDQQKQNIQNQKTNLDNAKNDIANQQNSINDSRNSLAGYADGTNNADYGIAEVAENGFEIVIGRQTRKFKGGEQVIPHSESANILSNNSSTSSNNISNNNDATNVLQNSQKFGQNLNKSLAQGINQSQNTVTNANKKVVDELDNDIQDFVDGSPKYAHDTNDNIGKSTANTKQLLKKPVSDLITEVMNEIQKFVDDSSKYGRDSNKNIGTGVNTTQESVINPTKALITNVKGLIDPFVDSFKGNGKNIDINIGQGLTDGHDGLMTDIDKLCKNIVDQFNKDLDIHSPSKVMYKIGQYMIQGLIKGMDESDIEKFISDKIGGMTSSAQGSVVAVPGNVSDWLTQAMKATGVDASWLPALEMMASRESGNPGTLGTGNATLVNSEGVGGEHATGLMQTLPSTFQSYAMAGHGNILNPIDNAIASINYIKDRYKTPYAIKNWNNSSYVGYQNGTSEQGAEGGISLVGEQGAEYRVLNPGDGIITSQKTKALNALADNYLNGANPLMPKLNIPDFSNLIIPKNNNQPNQTHYDINIQSIDMSHVQNPQQFLDTMTQSIKTYIG